MIHLPLTHQNHERNTRALYQEMGKLSARFALLATRQDVRNGVEKLAHMVRAGFDSADKNFARLSDTLQVRQDVDQLKTQMIQIRQALNLKA
jgi:hypothetical protein